MFNALGYFFATTKHDEHITVCHVALYSSLFECWLFNKCQNPISISRQQMMQMAKIKRTAYHKCMKELQEYGYIRYVPSYHPILGSLVYLNHLND